MKVLVLADDSEPALRAVRHAAFLFKEGSVSQVVLLNVQPPLPLGRACAFHSQQEFYRSEAQEGEAALQPACKILDEAGANYVKQVKLGEPASTISQTAANDCQGILLARGSALKALVSARLANKVLRLSHIPVTLVA